MRLMITFSMPTDHGNDIVGSGKIQQVFERILHDLKPEAAYFYPEGGDRGGVFFVQCDASADFVKLVEPLWFGLNAKVTATPVMSGEDLMKGMASLPAIASRYR